MKAAQINCQNRKGKILNAWCREWLDYSYSMILFTLFGTKVFCSCRVHPPQIWGIPTLDTYRARSSISHTKNLVVEKAKPLTVCFLLDHTFRRTGFYESLTWSATCFEMTLRFRFFVTDLLQIGHKFEGAPPSIFFLWRIWAKSVTFFGEHFQSIFFVTDLDQIRHIFFQATLPVRVFVTDLE